MSAYLQRAQEMGMIQRQLDTLAHRIVAIGDERCLSASRLARAESGDQDAQEAPLGDLRKFTQVRMDALVLERREALAERRELLEELEELRKGA